MLLVTIELIPGGYTPSRRTIASMRISNLSELADISDYRVEVMEGANRHAKTGPRNAMCTVVAHDRRQSVWALLTRAAKEIMTADFVEL